MSAMSASSGLMPLSLISEHKAAQGGPPAVQPLPRTPEKHSLVQAPKPTPNGMEPSPPLIPLLPPSQPEPQPSLPCGGKSDTANEEERSGGSVPEIEVPAAEPAPPSVATVPEQPLAAEAAEPPTAPELPIAINQAPSSSTSPSFALQAPVPTLPTNVTVQPTTPTEARTETEQESLPQPEAVPSPEPAQVPVSDVAPKAESAAEEIQNPTPSQEPQPSTAAVPTTSATADIPSTPPTPSPNTRKATKRAKQTASTSKKSTATVDEEETSGDEKKSKRKRLPTQPYQSPYPEINLIAKISKIDKTASSSADDKLIVFYRNEFLAVRNAEGGFYVCQTLQNVYKSSTKIRIRWLSQDENSIYYSPDFYDVTEFDCILTNLNLEKIEKSKFHLPEDEAQRTMSILKRAIDLEKGIAPPEENSITEEHPDGLDLSLYRNEDQLKKRKRSSKNKATKKKEKKGNSDSTLAKVRTSSRRVVRADSDSKKPSVVPVQPRRLGRPAKVEKPVVQRIVAAKKMGRRKLVAATAPAAVKQVKKETKPAVAVKRKSESQSPSVPEKKLKGASKTRSGVAGGPSGPQQRARRSSTRTK